MKKTLSLVTVFYLLAITAAAQPGGKATDAANKTTPKPATTSTKPAATTTTTTKPKSSPRTSSGPVASLNGKWWTSGNDFGASEVILVQTGSNVTGEIHYADGRTGTVTGTMTGHRLQKLRRRNRQRLAGTELEQLSRRAVA
jgi:hypothetical protein